MYAVGKIEFQSRVIAGYKVTLYVNGKYQDWILGNEEAIPSGSPDFGLFEFCPDDQFCYWRDPSSIKK